jgi:hypothetical protein
MLKGLNLIEKLRERRGAKEEVACKKQVSQRKGE